MNLFSLLARVGLALRAGRGSLLTSAGRRFLHLTVLLAALGTGIGQCQTTNVLARVLGGYNDDGAYDTVVDSEGNIYIAGDTTSPYMATAGAFQPFYAGAVAVDGGDAFVAKLSPEGRLIFFTYLGGSGNDGASAIALGPDGSIYVTGVTDSPNFPTRNAAWPFIKGRPDPYLPLYPYDAFVARLDPTGSHLIYSTYLGGSFRDQGTGIAVDEDGSAYVTGFTDSHDFPQRRGLQNRYSGKGDVFLTKFSPAGFSMEYSSVFGGGSSERGEGLVIDREGRVYITGFTTSRGFPVTTNAFQPVHGGGKDAFLTVVSASGTNLDYSTFIGGAGHDLGYRVALDGAGNPYICGAYIGEGFPLTPGAEWGGVFRTDNAGNNWSLSSAGLFANNILSLTLDPSNPSVVYAGTWRGVSRSLDAGHSWNPVLQKIAPFQAVAVDPSNPMVIYAGDTQVFKSTNGGSDWALSSRGLAKHTIQDLAVHPTSSNIVYASTSVGTFVSANGARSWRYAITGTGARPFYDLTFHPGDPEKIYNAGYGGLFVSTNRGARWRPLNTGLRGTGKALAIDPSNPSIFYLASTRGFYKSESAGDSWTNVPITFVDSRLVTNVVDEVEVVTNVLVTNTITSLNDVVLDVGNPAVVYAGGPSGMFRSLNAGQDWQRITNGFGSTYINQLATIPGAPNTVLAALYARSFGQAGLATDAFVTKFAGIRPTYSMDFGGAGREQAWDLAVDANGNAFVTGITHSRRYFPTDAAIPGLGTRLRGNSDAFVTAISADGTSYLYSGYIGGNGAERGLAIELDGSGAAVVVGRTSSFRFPVVDPFRAETLGPSDAFIFRISR